MYTKNDFVSMPFHPTFLFQTEVSWRRKIKKRVSVILCPSACKQFVPAPWTSIQKFKVYTFGNFVTLQWLLLKVSAGACVSWTSKNRLAVFAIIIIPKLTHK